MFIVRNSVLEKHKFHVRWYCVVKTKLIASKTGSAIATGSPPTEVLGSDQSLRVAVALFPGEPGNEARVAAPSRSYVNSAHNTSLWL